MYFNVTWNRMDDIFLFSFAILVDCISLDIGCFPDLVDPSRSCGLKLKLFAREWDLIR